MEVTSGNVQQTLSLGNPRGTNYPDKLAFHPDSKLLAVATKEGITLFDVATGAPRPDELRFDAEQKIKDPICWMAFQPGGKLLAAARHQGNVWLWNWAVGGSPRRLEGRWDEPVAWSPDSKRLVVGATVWDAKSGKASKRLDWVGDSARNQLWTSDATTILASQRDNTIRAWDVESGRVLRTVPGVPPGVFSIDGRVVASEVGGKVVVCDTQTGRRLATFVPLHDGRWLATRPTGEYRGSPRIESELVVVVQTDRGQQTLTPEEFSKKYGWKNDPSPVSWSDET